MMDVKAIRELPAITGRVSGIDLFCELSLRIVETNNDGHSGAVGENANLYSRIPNFQGSDTNDGSQNGPKRPRKGRFVCNCLLSESMRHRCNSRFGMRLRQISRSVLG
jgi:hypothetical protein